MFRSLAAAGIAVSLLAVSACNIAAAADGHDITVELRSVGGSGCTTGSVTVEAAPAGEALTLLYSGFRVTGRDRYKNCLVVVNVSGPDGWSYAIDQADTENDALLDAGATGELHLSSWFTGFPSTLTETSTLKGPYDAFWRTNNIPETLRWAPCGKSFNLTINETLLVDGPPSSAVAARTGTVHLRWRSCRAHDTAISLPEPRIAAGPGAPLPEPAAYRRLTSIGNPVPGRFPAGTTDGGGH